jgi:hypothetical protein
MTIPTDGYTARNCDFGIAASKPGHSVRVGITVELDFLNTDVEDNMHYAEVAMYAVADALVADSYSIDAFARSFRDAVLAESLPYPPE